MHGEELTPWLLRYGYERGAFPMTMDDGQVEWFRPFRRALFPIEGIKLSRSMRKVVSKVQFGERNGAHFGVTFNRQFEQVMRNCLRPDENWISEHFIRAYTACHFEGWGHSVEVWRSGKLVGGLYGLAIGSIFCAESMFHRETNASKVALWAMVDRCREAGFTLFDAQIMNPHLKSLGAYEIGDYAYLQLLEKAKSHQIDFDRIMQ